jgi:hypothetical protein
MPTQKLRVTRKEQEEHRSRRRQLQEMGVAVGSVRESVHRPNRFMLKQVWRDLARVYQRPLGDFSVVVYVTLNILEAGVVVRDSELSVAWEDDVLEYEDSEATPNYKELLQGSPCWPPTILNQWLTGDIRLQPGRHEGVIVAKGWTKVPSTWPDETPAYVELLVKDERDNELCFEFGANVDRSLEHKYERQSRERAALRFTRAGLYGPAKTEIRDQTRTLQEEDGRSVSTSRADILVDERVQDSTLWTVHRARQMNRVH